MKYGLAFLLPLLIMVSATEAQVYKWVDENGKVHFSDQPPRKKPASAEKVELKIAPKTGNRAAPSAAERAKQQQELLRRMEGERKQRESQRAKAKEEKKRLAELCKKLKKEMEEKVRANAIYTENDKGERVYDSEEVADQKRKRAVERYQTQCQPK